MKFAKWYMCELDDDGYTLSAYRHEFIGKLFYKFSNSRCKIFVKGNTKVIRDIIRKNYE